MIPLTVETAYTAFLLRYQEKRSGESGRRLQEGLGHAEKLFLGSVWWPAVGHFDHLHPEYEVYDFKDGTRFLDFAYLREPFQVCFELDGYGPHLRDTSRWQFADQLWRQNHLVIEGWKVIRFAYDDIQDKPRRCQQLIQQLLGKWFGDDIRNSPKLTLKQREIIRFAIHAGRPIRRGKYADSSKSAIGMQGS
ncbi:DNA-binding response regulator [Paenibacillus ginsengarvi]|uniref:DNA-binding response regulator n=1 Tax=Paenibacillus ginsengarvi TaxID=400777 RepID=UPI001EFFBF47|nr:DNA-binding response regulator [Paenibacillus ginsengarvi]